MKPFDLLIFIGRFQPFHTEHKRVIDQALESANKVLVLVGSSGKARSVRNPFTFEERQRMITDCFSDYADRLIVKPLYDRMYNDTAWMKQVQHIVRDTALGIINNNGFACNGLEDAKIGLIGAAKDHTSYYLKMFPQFSSVDVSIRNVMHATSIREGFLAGTLKKHECAVNELPMPVANFLYNEFAYTQEYHQLRDELSHVKAYKKSWKAAPYPVKHVTVDAVVEQSGHILLIKRKDSPGKGLWALPGGHLEEYETVVDGIIRELKEETQIDVSTKDLKKAIVSREVFDDPHRSTLGRVITHAAHIKLDDATQLQSVEANDDAVEAAWVAISDIREDLLFDDHYFIIAHFLGFF